MGVHGQHRRRGTAPRVLAYPYGDTAERGSGMATNTGENSRRGAVRNRFQLVDVASGLFVVLRATTGEILRVKKSPGPAKGISKRLPKKYRSG